MIMYLVEPLIEYSFNINIVDCVNDLIYVYSLNYQ